MSWLPAHAVVVHIRQVVAVDKLALVIFTSLILTLHTRYTATRKDAVVVAGISFILVLLCNAKAVTFQLAEY